MDGGPRQRVAACSSLPKIFAGSVVASGTSGECAELEPDEDYGGDGDNEDCDGG